ncbi:SpoIIE family protein phosphatase [Luteolibacter luteus]|uniref:PP2C family protein-serine/threonine phosphatase n=1 Tax=Luteolibacter luteus TaxID=2728835 RepID=A0A858RMA1_9BACT|nr:SpoIIE family protein phosphatase [Luteolibacter luteus]QJE97624.1 PP2C family protein-serine/threonine phosphatase [Luteolibacter luteus]
MGLRGKFATALAIAAVLPLAVGLIVLQTFGFRHLLATKGRQHEAEAAALARSLESSVESQAGNFWSWIAADPSVPEFVAQADTVPADAQATKDLEARWRGLSPEDPVLKSILTNRGSNSLVRFAGAHRQVAEVLIADNTGRMIAASGKTSDYDQSDEEWWQIGRSLKERGMWTDELHFDESAGVFSLDLVLPVYREKSLKGVAKLVLDVTPMFQRLRPDSQAGGGRLEILLPDGRLLARGGKGYRDVGKPLDPDSVLAVRIGRSGWTLTKPGDDDVEMMTGFAAIQSRSVDRQRFEPGGYVLFSSPKAEVVAPLRRQILMIGTGAGLATGFCLLCGYALVSRKILSPLSVLGQAARSVSATARLRKDVTLSDDEAFALRKTAEEDLARIESIRTGDEVEELAADLGIMTSRVMRYNRELEEEVDAKTSLIREELEMAREFQTALMPSLAPGFSVGQVRDPMRLGFAHFYQPASTVGGDFFDLIELDEHRTGVLIADVMGHGARSALVTAILRAVVRNHVISAGDPGKFLGILNRELHEVIERSHQTLFVTAFFMVLDTKECRAHWAVAGHPSPLRARRSTGNPPQLLWTGAQRQPALGLLPEVNYQSSSSQIRVGDVFLLFTDGVVEAENPGGKDFGIQRLISTFDESLDGPLAAMPAKIVCEVAAFQKRKHHDDDVCVVAVEVIPGAIPEIITDPAALTGSVPSGA